MLLKDQITTTILELLAELENYFLVEIKISAGHKKVVVFIDSPVGVDVEDCAALSRKLADVIELNNWIEDSYHLEVSSPGIDQPLKLQAQYPQHIGRKLHITTNDGAVLEGKLLEIKDQELFIEAPKPKKKTKEPVTINHFTILFGDIKEAKVQIEFK